MSFKGNGITGTTIRLFPCVFAINRINDCVAVPTNQGVSVFLQGIGNITFFFTMFPNAHNAFALLCSIFNLPINPIAVFVWGEM